MRSEPINCSDGGIGCEGAATQLYLGALFGAPIGIALAVRAFPCTVVVIVSIVPLLARNIGIVRAVFLTLFRVIACEVVLDTGLSMLMWMLDLPKHGRWLPTFVFGPGAFERSGWSFGPQILGPLISLHFWLVAWDAWRWHRRTIAEHEARQRGESATRTPS